MTPAVVAAKRGAMEMQANVRLGRIATVTSLLWAALLAPTDAHAWGCAGHQTVALIAQSQLSSAARAKADSLLKDNPIRMTMTKQGQPLKLRRLCPSPLGAFVDASTWPDDIRAKENKPFDKWHSADWHFLDIPRGAARDRVPTFCPNDGCVTQAIRDQVAILQSDASNRKKADALRFLIHFVGDIHQPLHCTTNSDRGGNCVPVKYLDRQGHLEAGKLHAAWDTNMIEADPVYPGVPKLKGFATALTTEFQAQIPTWKSAGAKIDAMQATAEDWAWDSHQLAESTAYGKLPTQIPVEPERGQLASCVVNGEDISKRMAQFHEQLEQPYESAADPVIHEQLTKAGIRLALILNAIWQ